MKTHNNYTFNNIQRKMFTLAKLNLIYTGTANKTF